MNRSDVAALLTVIASYDRRTLGEAEVIAWHGVLGDLPFEQCRDAVIAHYATQTDWLMPAHVRRHVLTARQDRAMRELPAGPSLPPEAPETFGGLPIPGAPSWVRQVYETAKAQQHAINEQRKTDGLPPTYGKTVMASTDGAQR